MSQHVFEHLVKHDATKRDIKRVKKEVIENFRKYATGLDLTLVDNNKLAGLIVQYNDEDAIIEYLLECCCSIEIA